MERTYYSIIDITNIKIPKRISTARMKNICLEVHHTESEYYKHNNCKSHYSYSRPDHPVFHRFVLRFMRHKKRGLLYPLNYISYSVLYQPIAGAVRATGVTSAAARSNGKLWALRSCITSKPRFARLRISAQVLITRPSEERSD